MIKQIVTDSLPETLHYPETGRGSKSEREDFKDAINPLM